MTSIDITEPLVGLNLPYDTFIPNTGTITFGSYLQSSKMVFEKSVLNTRWAINIQTYTIGKSTYTSHTELAVIDPSQTLIKVPPGIYIYIYIYTIAEIDNFYAPLEKICKNNYITKCIIPTPNFALFPNIKLRTKNNTLTLEPVDYVYLVISEYIY